RTNKFDFNYVEIYMDKFSRLLVVLEKKIFTFNFPFAIRKNVESNMIDDKIYDIIFDNYTVDFKHISALRSVFNSDNGEKNEDINLAKITERTLEALIEFPIEQDR